MLIIVCCLIANFGIQFPMQLTQTIKFGKIIRKYREEAGISQEELGNLADLHRTYIGMIERGEKNITLINIVKLSKALNVPLSKIFASLEEFNEA